MTDDPMQHVDDLTPDEAAGVVRAYDTIVAQEDHEEAFAAALDVFRRLRPALPPFLIAIELELLLALAPPDTVAVARYA